MAEKTINGRTFKHEPMLAEESMELQAELFRLAGPAMAHLGGMLAGVGAQGEDDIARSNIAAVAAFNDIFQTTPPREYAQLVKKVCEMARIKRPSGNYEKLHFNGDMTDNKKDIIPLVVWVIQEEYGDFFGGFEAVGNLRKLNAA
jgi:hypothetical protein